MDIDTYTVFVTECVNNYTGETITRRVADGLSEEEAYACIADYSERGYIADMMYDDEWESYYSE